MLVKMLATVRGSQSGFGVELFNKGIFYDMADSLAGQFIQRKHAEKVVLVDECTNPAWYNLFHSEVLC